MTQATTTRKQTEITATAIYKVTTKATGLTCWAVPSDSSSEMYTCCWDEQATRWTCSCKAGQNGMMCKHVRAVQTSILANKAVAKPATAQAPDVEIESERAAYLASTHQTTSDTISHIEEENQPQPIHDGYYTVSFDGEHRTFRVRTQDQDASFAPGKQIISFLSGPCNGSDYTGFAFIIDGQVIPWKRFSGYSILIDAARFLVQGDHTEAGKMYAQESGNCYICNRLLTTPESIANGIGPVCASKVGVAIATPDEIAAIAETRNEEKLADFRNFYEQVGDPRVETKRACTRTCLYCGRQYTRWTYPDDPDGLCSEKCEKALNELYGEPVSERDEAETRRINWELSMGL